MIIHETSSLIKNNFIKKNYAKKIFNENKFYNKNGIKKVLGEDDKQVRNLFKRLRLIENENSDWNGNESITNRTIKK